MVVPPSVVEGKVFEGWQMDGVSYVVVHFIANIYRLVGVVSFRRVRGRPASILGIVFFRVSGCFF